MADEKEEQQKKGAKDYSLFSMIIAGLWIGILSVLKGVGVIHLEIKEEIIPSGIAIAGVFSPVYFSIFLDKIRNIKVS